MSTKLSTYTRFYYFLLLTGLSCFVYPSFSQDTLRLPPPDTIISNATDSLLFPPDSIPSDTHTSDSLIPEKKKSAIDHIVEYESQDSITFHMKDKIVNLYGNYGQAKIDYNKISLTSAHAEINFNNNVLRATSWVDSTGKEIGKPEFTENGESFTSREMLYNFETRKGLIRKVITQEGEGYLHGDTIKKMNDDIVYIRHGSYTTCDHEHPHFELRFSKAKVIPEDKIVTGPAVLYVLDIPTPLFVPFGLFPNKKGRTSGIVIPSYGESANRGFYLENGGYYFGGSDYIDLELKGDIYSRGSWAIKTLSNYNIRYRFNGSISANYAINILGDKGTTDYSKSNDFSLRWQHNQSSKARPHSRFSANVNLLSSQYNKFNPTTSNQYLSNTFSSSVSYSTTIADKYHLSLSLLHTQNTIEKTVNLTLPEVTFSVNRFYPFRNKEKTGKFKWYENISMDYKMNTKNRISTYDSLLFQADVWERFQNGMSHNIPVSSSIKILKYFNLTNTFNYNEKWYLSHIEKHWNYDTLISGEDTTYGYLDIDTINGFKAARDFSFSSRLNTKLYGMLNFKKGPLRAVRHVVTPSIGFSYRPDFSNDYWGYYRTYTDTAGNVNQYSIFEGSLYGSPPGGKSGTIDFSISNNLEMKVRSRKDTVTGMKKIVLIENFSLSSRYNMAADSMNWSKLTMSGRTRLLKNIDLTYNSSWDPYARDSAGNRYNEFEWTKNKRLFRLENTSWNLSFNWRLSSEKSQGNDEKTSEKGTEEELNMINQNPDDYVDFNIPWSLNIRYNFRYSKNYNSSEQERIEDIVQTLSFNGDINLTPKWKIGLSSGYDFENEKLSYTSVNIYRDLHCWEMSFNWIPIGFRKSWNFTIKAKSSLLQDLKLQKKKDFRDF